ncbi:bifunctional diguanylate cyclase/phosphodiesterase [Sulfurimonas sp. SAG-AH-194-I05]|nr:bifunctional diguanylate cyclase/phosphodiesterase [Sulfurimonas sp. SAG-AH-194-I05]MDF1875849.1 bifunctional diguanylate cyclase/phosphodiesterase [Sulfurimonas sp. SAG-AH-194-I05]
MTIILIAFLVFIIISLLIWIKRMKRSLKEHFEIERELQYEVGHDGLTGLANASLTTDRLNQAIKNAKRYKKKIAIFYINVDYFQQINNSAGFDISNEILEYISEQLLEIFYESDTVARIEGNEFVIVIDSFSDAAFLQSLVDKIMKISKKALHIQHHKINVHFSIGVSIYPDDSVDAFTLFSHAYTAMRMIKSSACNGYKYYTQELAQDVFKNERLEHELVDSINENQMEVYYQLQINTKDNSLIGMEALIRWRHPTMGLITPEKFIHLSEEIGFVVAIDTWVMQEAISQYKKWHEDGLNPRTLSLNLSMQKLEEENFVNEVKSILENTPCLKENLSFHILETYIMHNPKRFIKKLHELSALGISFSIDNFGAFASSLEYLQKLPIDKLIIDRSFIVNILENKNDANIVKTIIAIAKNMNLGIIAEGVETQEQSTFLVKNKCFHMQGNFYHKPETVAEVTIALQKYEEL